MKRRRGYLQWPPRPNSGEPDKEGSPLWFPQNWGRGGLWRLAAFLLLALAGQSLHAGPPKVVVINIHGSVWPGTATFVKQQLDAAYQQGAAGVILDLDTTQGSPAAAEEIKQAIMDHAASLPIAAYVHDRALGPGSLIALSCKTLALAPGASLGNAPSDSSKTDYRAAAEANGRNPAIAAAFVSADADLPSVGVKAGDSLTLTAKQAQSVGYSDVIASYDADVLAKMGPGLAGAQTAPVNLDPWTAAALWITQPWATILLLALGLMLVIVEMATLHSWGVAGILGGILIALIFAAYITVGAATWIGLLLFLAGAALLLVETHFLPGHGLPAMAGLVLIFTGMFYALGGAQAGALYSAGAALLTTLGLLTAFFLYLPRSGVWKRLGQPMRQTASAGYVSSSDYTGLLGQIGVAATLLRPSGTAEFDGERLSVVTEGEFIPQGAAVQVVMVQGSRIVVRATE